MMNLRVRIRGLAWLLALASAPLANVSAPCTTFCLPGQEGAVFARNYDWQIGVGLVFVNKRNLSKTALVGPQDTPAAWTSRYGSLTFNQYGREFPLGGMNEAGLVVELMWLSDTGYPARDERPALRELAWIQYQLDSCRSVEEVLATDAKLRILGDSVPVHFLVCDSAGGMATVEFLGGEMVVHRGDSLHISALTNSPYAKSLEYLEGFQGFGGDQPVSSSTGSLDRFVRAACGVVDYDASPAEETVAYAFGILADVSQGLHTRWSIVYDVENLTIHFKTQVSPTIKTLELASFDFSPTTPCRTLDIDTPRPGDAGAFFVDYTTEANRELIFEAWKSTSFLADTPDETLNLLAEYPETLVVADPERVDD